MSTLCYSLLMVWFLYLLFSADYWYSYSRFNSLKVIVFPIYKVSFMPVMGLVFIAMSSRFVFMVSLANVPFFMVPSVFYSYIMFNSFIVWLPVVLYALSKDSKSFISHMLPYGAPMGLMLLLPLVEIFSQLIRPFTLTIRFATNLSAGHIMMFMFSYFSILSSTLAPVLYLVLAILMVMEIFIAFLQAYIFFTLLSLYLSETL